MGMLTHILLQTFRKITVTRNIFGDLQKASAVTMACRFRYITKINRGLNREALESVDALIHFEPDAAISEGDIGQVDGKYWRIDRLTKARGFDSEAVQFLKAEVTLYELPEVS